MSTCRFTLKRKRCKQPIDRYGFCGFHLWYHALTIKGVKFRLDDYYHRKVLEGTVTPTWGELSESEAHALFDRPHNDGRRLDDWAPTPRWRGDQEGSE